MTEAASQLQKGLDTLARIPNSPLRQQQELDLQIALGPARLATSGFSASSVGETYARARILAEQLDRPEYLVSLLYGEWAFYCIRSEYKLAMPLAEQLERVGEIRNDIDALLLGHFAHAATHLWLGEFVAARSLYEQCHEMNNPARRTHYMTMTGTDQYLAVLCQLAMTLVYLGEIDSGRSRMSEAVSAARQLGHLHSLVFVLALVCQVEALTGSPQQLKRYGEEMVAVSNEHGFPYWLGWGMANCGTSLVALGQAQEGHKLITEALSMIRSTGGVLGTQSVLMGLAVAQAALGRPFEGLNCLTEALQITEMTDERFIEAGLHRLRGQLLTAIGDRAAAQQSYHQSLIVARRQSAKYWELRAATSLARLWRDQGKRTEAHDLLAPIYDWFTEGFETPVLKEAKALLDELA
jgi:predicted ATPase